MTLVTLREELRELVDTLPESELPAARRFLRYLRDMAEDPVLQALAGAATDDEPITEEEAAKISAGEEDVRRGDILSDEELRRELGI